MPYLAVEPAATPTDVRVDASTPRLRRGHGAARTRRDGGRRRIAARLARVTGVAAGVARIARRGVACTASGPHAACASRRRAGRALAEVLVSGAPVMVHSFIGSLPTPTGVERIGYWSHWWRRTRRPRHGHSLRPHRADSGKRSRSLPGSRPRRPDRSPHSAVACRAAPVEVPGSSLEPASWDGRRHQAQRPSVGASAPFNRVLAGILRTVGTPVIAGRDFDSATPRRLPVAVVNRRSHAPLRRRATARATIIIDGKR